MASKTTAAFLGGLLILGVTACKTEHKIEIAPVEVKPIHITIDVNIRVDRALNDFFGDLDEATPKGTTGNVTE